MSAFFIAMNTATAPHFWGAAALFFAALLLLLNEAARQFRYQRLMANTATSKIRSAAQGYVEMQGYAALLPGDPIYATLSGLPCVWFRYQVECRENSFSRGRSDRNWHTIDKGISEHLFALRDGTGSCVVDPEGAHVTPSAHDHWYGDSPLPGGINRPANWVRWLGLAGFGRQYRYSEERIAIGAPLVALGQFRSMAGANSDAVNQDVAALLHEWKQDQVSLKNRFDANRDGVIDEIEWAAARRAAEQEVAATDKLPPAVDTLIDSRDHQRPFLLSAGTEDALETRARLFACALGLVIFVGSVCLLSCLVLRLSRHGG